MPGYRLTRRTLADLRDTARYTGETWGRRQARLYVEELELRIRKLALSPEGAREFAPRNAAPLPIRRA